MLASEALFEPTSIGGAMRRLGDFLGFPPEEADESLLHQPSPASAGEAAPHENGRVYVAEPPAELRAELARWFCSWNQVPPPSLTTP